MKSFTAVVVLALTVVVNAQGTPPPCATDCVTKTPTKCAQSDISCLCHDSDFITQATQCILTTCQGADVQAAEQFAQTLCETVGVTLTSTPSLPTSTGSGSPSGSGSGTGTATASGSSGSATSPASGSATTGSSPAASSAGSAATFQPGMAGLLGTVLALFAF